MASKLQQYSQLADRTAQQITGSYQMWTAFLETAARLYKYPYHEQLMIFAQRPEATACADYDLWNKQMHRYVRRGSQGIALIDTTGDQPRLKYVFDVSDTGGGENSRRPYLWQYQQEHREVVAAALERRFEVSGENGLAEQLERVSAQLVDEFWNDHQRDMENLISLRPPQYDGLSGHFGMTTAPMFWCCRIPLRNTGIMRIAFVIIMMKLKSVKTLPRHTTSLQFRYATGK